MSHNAKESLDRINKVSRQILSRILALHNDFQPSSLQENLAGIEEKSAKKDNKELTELMENRQILITRLFEQNTAENISVESELVQEMIALDSKLTANAKLAKQTITEQVIKIKNSKNVTKSYQKY